MKIFVVILTMLPLLTQAQIYVKGLGYVIPAIELNGDTIPYMVLKETVIVSKRIFKSKKDELRYTRLVHNVKKAYPYAKLAREKLMYYEALIAVNPRNKKRLMKQAETDMKNELEKKLQNLTFTQGKILLKLIDRETKRSSYYLVKDLRGSTRAWFYQGIAFFFGMNLKVKYDPAGEDYEIEQIVQRLESEETKN